MLADISHHTSFLRSVEVAHRDDAFAGGAVPDAYAMRSSLLDGIVARPIPPVQPVHARVDALPPTETYEHCAPIRAHVYSLRDG